MKKPRRVPAKKIALGLLAAQLFSCRTSPEEKRSEQAVLYGETICTAIDRCECPRRFDSTPSCVEEFARRFDAATSTGRALVQTECFEKSIQRIADDDCSDLSWTLDEQFLCTSLQGALKLESECSNHREIPVLRTNECSPGLTCGYDGHCVLPSEAFTDTRTEGDTCSPNVSPLCSIGLYCGISDDTCHVMQPAGSPCESTFACTAGTYCHGDGSGAKGTCSPVHSLGEACEPADYLPCVSPDPSIQMSCNPVTRTCVAAADAVGVCDAMTHPLVRP